MKKYLIFLFIIFLAPIVYSQFSDLDPVRVENVINRGEFYPTEILQVVPELYNQKGELLSDTAQIMILNPEGKEVVNEVIQTNERFTYEFSQFALPGTWIVKTYAGSWLSDVDEVNVLRNTLVDLTLKDGVLLIENIGNVDYNGEIVINVLGDKETSIVKKPFLKPRQSIVVDLRAELDNGLYNLVVGHDGVEENFDNIVIGGVTAARISIWGLLALMVILVVVSYFLFKNEKRIIKRSPFSKQYFDRLEKKESTIPPMVESKPKRKEPKPDIKRLDYGWRKRTEDTRSKSLQYKDGLDTKYK